jgi:hypothetical protein
MDLKIYYQKIRQIEQGLKDPSVLLVSKETPDGGKDGVRTEVSRRTAAKMVVEGTARIATADETAEFQKQKAEAKRRADQIAAASRMQFTVVPADLRAKGVPRPGGE